MKFISTAQSTYGNIVPFAQALDPLRLLGDCGKFVAVWHPRAGFYIVGFCTIAEREVSLVQYLRKTHDAHFVGSGRYARYVHKQGLSMIQYGSLPCIIEYGRDRPCSDMEAELLLHDLRREFLLPVIS
jgi:hypothetical protein